MDKDEHGTEDGHEDGEALGPGGPGLAAGVRGQELVVADHLGAVGEGGGGGKR